MSRTALYCFHPTAPKPMIEFSVMMRTSEHSTVKQFKYLKVLVQEMAVKLDMGFLSSIAGLFAPSKDEEVDEVTFCPFNKLNSSLPAPPLPGVSQNDK